MMMMMNEDEDEDDDDDDDDGDDGHNLNVDSDDNTKNVWIVSLNNFVFSTSTCDTIHELSPRCLTDKAL